MSGGTPQQQTSTQTSSQNSTTQPPSYAMPYVTSGLNRMENLANQPYTPYTGETVAPINWMQNEALKGIYDYTSAPNAIINNATTNMAATLGGDYLNPQSNPFLAQYAQQALGDVTRNYQNSTVPQLSAAASRAGAFGGSADTLMRTEQMRNLGDTLSKTATNIYEPAYQQERQLQMQAQALAPQTIQMPLTMQTAKLGAGDVYQQQQQAIDNAAMQQWQQQQQWPYFAANAAAQMFPIYGWGNQMTGGGTTNLTGTMQPSAATSGQQGMGMGMAGLGTMLPFMSSFFGGK